MTSARLQFTRITLMLLTLTPAARAEPVPIGKGPSAPANPSSSDLQQAARLFDQGVQQFSRREYESSARSFLAADDLQGNTQALLNAIAAARRANNAVLTAQSAQRAVDRADLDPESVKLVREALATARARVATLQLRCEPEPCTLLLDSVKVVAGTHYAPPGIHVVSAEGARETRAKESVNGVEGGEYRVVLRLVPTRAYTAGEAGTGPAFQDAAGRTGPNSGKGKGTKGHSRWMASSAGAAEDRETHKPFSPFVFGLGCTGTVALVALTTWSGLEVLSARELHETD
ncbi:MAG TPA: hypothetical protein VK524_35270, partial [Polyangiaceae bacterium]|nr:hypothetical protein [Polyangiaceae bacterium]